VIKWQCKLAVSTLLCAVSAFACNGGSNDPAAVVPSSFVNPSGWTIPGKDVARLKNPRHISYLGAPFEAIDYTVPAWKVLVPDTRYEMSADGKSLTIRNTGDVFVVESITEFQIAGKTFAYSIQAATAPAPKKPWHPLKGPVTLHNIPGGVYGCGYTYLNYYDMDGSGRFTLYEPRLDVGYVVPVNATDEEKLRLAQRFSTAVRVPGWAAALANQPKN